MSQSDDRQGERVAPPADRSDTQERALALMRANHGKIISGEGVSISTMRVLEREGLVTMTTWRAADRILSNKTRFEQFSAELTDAGWGGHPRTTAPKYPYGEPTPVSDLQPGDQVRNAYSGAMGIWKGLNGLGTYTVDCSGAPLHTEEVSWRFVSRPEKPQVSESALPVEDDETTWARDQQGRRFFLKERIEWRASDGWIHSGLITGFAADERGTLVTFAADTKWIGPPARAPKGLSRKPGPPRPIDPVESITVLLDKRITPA